MVDRYCPACSVDLGKPCGDGRYSCPNEDCSVQHVRFDRWGNVTEVIYAGLDVFRGFGNGYDEDGLYRGKPERDFLLSEVRVLRKDSYPLPTVIGMEAEE